MVFLLNAVIAACLFFSSTISANLACEPPQDMLGEHARGPETGSFFHQLHKYVFSILVDGRKALHIDHDLATIQACFCLPPHSRQLRSQWANQLALDDQSAATRGVDNGDLQHWF